MRLLFVAGLVALLSACAADAPKKAEAPARLQPTPFSVVSTGDSRVNFTQASSWAWLPEMQLVSDDPRFRDSNVDSLLEAAISTVMQEKGYAKSSVPGSGDLLVGYLVTLNGPDTQKQIGESYGVQPSLNMSSPDTSRYEKGTLVIDVIDRDTGWTAWRSALQGFASFELSESERAARIKSMVTRMLGGLPRQSASGQ